MITLILFRKVRVSHGAPPSLPQALHHAAVERIVRGHLCYGNMQHIVQSLEDTEPEGDLRQLRVSRLHQPQYHIRVIDIVGEYSGEPVLVSGIAVRTIKYMIRLSRNARDAGDRCSPSVSSFTSRWKSSFSAPWYRRSSLRGASEVPSENLLPGSPVPLPPARRYSVKYCRLCRFHLCRPALRAFRSFRLPRTAAHTYRHPRSHRCPRIPRMLRRPVPVRSSSQKRDLRSPCGRRGYAGHFPPAGHIAPGCHRWSRHRSAGSPALRISLCPQAFHAAGQIRYDIVHRHDHADQRLLGYTTVHCLFSYT